jgi:hypothetical protein
MIICFVLFKTYIRVESLSSELPLSDVKVSIVNPLEQESRLKLDARGAGEFIPEHAGMHEIVLTVDDIRYPNILRVL